MNQSILEKYTLIKEWCLDKEQCVVFRSYHKRHRIVSEDTQFTRHSVVQYVPPTSNRRLQSSTKKKTNNKYFSIMYLITYTNQIISQLFYNGCCFSRLHSPWVVCNYDGLFCANTNQTFCLVLAVN